MEEAYLRAGTTVVWGDLLAWPVSDRFLSSTTVKALHEKMFCMFAIQSPPSNLWWTFRRKSVLTVWSSVPCKVWINHCFAQSHSNFSVLNILFSFIPVELLTFWPSVWSWCTYRSWNGSLLVSCRVMIPSLWHHSPGSSWTRIGSTVVWVPQLPVQLHVSASIHDLKPSL